MSLIPDHLLYANSHEWLWLLPDGIALLGITDYAQRSLGDITYVQLPKPGTELTAGVAFGVVESVKAASDVYAPVAGLVLEANPLLAANPETLNMDPYGQGWMLKLRIPEGTAPAGLLSSGQYATLTG